MKCFAYAGIEAIRKALQAGEDASTEDVKISVRLVAPPLYVMTTTSTDKAQAIEVMEKAVDIIGEVISKEGGDLTVKMKVSTGRQARALPARCCGLCEDRADPSPKSSARQTMPSSRRSWSNSSRPTRMLRATTIQRRRIRLGHRLFTAWKGATGNRNSAHGACSMIIPIA